MARRPPPARAGRWPTRSAHLTYFDGTAAAGHHRPRRLRRGPRRADRRCAGRRGDEAVDELTLGAVADDDRPADLLAAWRRQPAAAGRRRRHPRRRHPGAVVRAVDGRQVVPHRPAHGVLGARPGHCRHRRHRRRRAPGHRPPAPHRPARLHHPGLVVPQPRREPPEGEVARRAHRPVGCHLDLGHGGVGRSGAWRLRATARRRQVVDTVRGPALDFCLVVTQRRHLDDTALDRGGEAGPTTGCSGPRPSPVRATDRPGPEGERDGRSSRPNSTRGRAHRHPCRRGQRATRSAADLVGELIAVLDAADADPAVRVVVLTNVGTVFCAGANLSEQSSRPTRRRAVVDPQRLFARFRRSPKPYVGRIAGHCVAGGHGPGRGDGHLDRGRRHRCSASPRCASGGSRP